MTCSDLCTAAKCEELENRMGALEQALELLEASFEAHTQQDIPEAHGFNFEVPEPEPTDDSSVNVTITGRGDNTFLVTVKVGNEQDSDGFTVDIPDLPEIPEPVEPEVSIGVFELVQDTYGISVQVGTKQAQDEFTITHPDLPEIPEPTDNNQHVKSNLNGSASFRDGVLTITIADGESFDSFQTSIPTNSSPQTIFITEEVYMNCDELENKFDDCCGQIIGALNNLSNELANVANGINTEVNKVNTEVNKVYDQVTIDISGNVNSGYTCKFPVNDDDSPIATYAGSTSTEIALSGQGLTGIQQYLSIISSNLDVIHADVCKAVDPIFTITVQDLFKHCLSLDIKREDYAEGTQGDLEYQAAQEAYLSSLLTQSKYANLIGAATNDSLITAPSNWTNQILTDFGLIQGRINNTALCAIEPSEQGDVVSIVASDKVIARASGKFLVLHFVELTNYPKRSSSSSYWQAQIPAAQESYTWTNDFEALRWQRGNLYAELVFNEFNNPVSGWFESENAANSYFDAVLNLTTATEKNRKFHTHSNPQTAVQTRSTRPYRAFITSVNATGEAVCHVKYLPLIEAN